MGQANVREIGYCISRRPFTWRKRGRTEHTAWDALPIPVSSPLFLSYPEDKPILRTKDKRLRFLKLLGISVYTNFSQLFGQNQEPLPIV